MKSANTDSTRCEYENDLSDDKTFLIVRLREPVTYKVAKAFTDDTVELAARLGIKKFLIDARGFGCELSSLQAYLFAQDFLQAHLFAQKLENMGRMRFHKLALVVNQTDDTYAFLETITRNRGINTRIFIDYNDAVAWL